MYKYPFCGEPMGFHEYADVGDEDNTCVHCGRTKHEIEGEDDASGDSGSNND